jgi:hypothetical protein
MYKNIKLTTQNISENTAFTNYKSELCFRLAVTICQYIFAEIKNILVPN